MLLFIPLPPLNFTYCKDNAERLQKIYKNVSKSLNIEIVFVSLHPLTTP
nr:MAG TPA: DsbA family protein [Caudoviricetes sp.]